MSDTTVKQKTFLDDDDAVVPAPPETPEFDDDTSTTITLDEKEPEIEIEVLEDGAAPNPEPEKTAEPEKPASPTEQELEEKVGKDNVQKRIDQLTYEKREAERQNDELVALGKKLIARVEELEAGQQTSNVAHYKALQTAIEEKERAAKQQLRTAVDEADNEKIVEANAALAEVKAQKIMLQSRAPREPAKATKTETTTTPVTTAKPQPRLNPRTVTWLGKNSGWFEQPGHDNMTKHAYGLSDSLIAQGVVEGSDDYYAKIDAGMRETFPDRFKEMDKTTEQTAETDTKGQGAKPAASARPPVGGVRASGARGNSRKVQLTPSQVQVAKGLGLTPQQYAQQLVKEAAGG